MRRLACVAAAGLAAFLCGPVLAAATAPDSARIAFVGRYLVNGDAAKAIVITPVARGAVSLVAADWEGVGLFDGTAYWGVFRHRPNASSPGLAGATGTHRATLRPDGSLTVHGEFTAGSKGSFEAVWMPEPGAGPRSRTARPAPPSDRTVPPPEAPAPSGLPQLGEYVYVEELPEALTKVAPSYPQAARDAKIQGTVLVQALVGEDGRVKDTKVIKSIPELDGAAVEAVRQWVFKPAMTKGRPVAVWVATPVRFSLH